MSWVRWSADSSLYIYDDVRGGITCCGCCIYDDFNCETEKEMASHILEHAKARHLVPERVVAMAMEIDPSLVFPKPSKILTTLKIAKRGIRVWFSMAWKQVGWKALALADAANFAMTRPAPADALPTAEEQSIIRKRVAYEIEQWMGENWTRDYPLAAQETDKILDKVFGKASDSMADLSEDYAKDAALRGTGGKDE